MTNSPKTIVAAAVAAAALCAPVAAQAHGHGQGQGHGNRAAHQLGQRGFHAPRTTNVLLQGTVVSVDAGVVTVDVKRADRHGRALVGQQVQLDLSAGRVFVHDVNADGVRDLADVATGDRVVAQLRVARGVAIDATQPLAALRLLDAGPAPAQDN